MHALAGGLQDRAQEGDGGALAVGTGDVDHRRQLALRMIERGEQTLHAIERQIDALGVQRVKPRDDRVNRRRHSCDIMAARSRVRRNRQLLLGARRRRLGQQPA